MYAGAAGRVASRGREASASGAGATAASPSRATSTSSGGSSRAKGSRTWIDLTNPSAELVQAVGAAARAASAHRRGHRREATSGRRSSSSATSSTSSRSCSIASDEVRGARGRLRPRAGLPAVRPSGRAGTRRRRTSCGWASGRCWSAGRTTCCGRSSTRSSTATSRSSTGWATRSTRSRTRPSRRPIPATLEHVFRLKRELIRIRHVLAPSREVFAQLTSREFGLIARAERLLLPRRVRPPDPAERRARHVPRAGRRLARGLPLDDQQQPVDDHEAPHRRDRDPRRHRRDRRPVRDERGGKRARAARRARAST